MASNDAAALVGGIRLPSGEVTEGRRSARTLRKRNAVVACSLDLTGKRVLDIGCAEGLHAMYMASSAKEVVGVDHRSTQINKAANTAQALNIRNVRFETLDIRDPDFVKRVGRFDIAIAWGFIHRIADIFEFLYRVDGIADNVCLEWRTPVVPLMSELSIAYHPPGHRALDPLNLNNGATSGSTPPRDHDKIEGDTAFWEPTPGAIKAIMKRLGFLSQQTIGYGEDLQSEDDILSLWGRHLTSVSSGKAKLVKLPRARVHMLFQRQPGCVVLNIEPGLSKVPVWDEAFHQAHSSKRSGFGAL